MSSPEYGRSGGTSSPRRGARGAAPPGVTAIILWLVLSVLPRPGALSLEEARELALAHSRSLAKYRLTIEARLLEERAENFTFLPGLSLEGSVSTELWRTPGLTAAGAALGLSETVTVYDGGKLRIRKAINGLNTEAARRDALRAYYEALDGVDEAYYGVLKAQAAAEAAEAALEKAGLALEIAETRLAGGMVSRGDYLQALADKESGEGARNQARGSLNVARLKLRNLTGLKNFPEEGLAAVDFERYEGLLQRLSGLPPEEEAALGRRIREAAAANNPDLGQAALSLRLAEENLKLARRGYFPSVSATLSTGLSYDYRAGLDPFGTGSLTLKASVPLDFWVTGAEVKRQRLSQEGVRLDYQEAVEALDLEVEAALLELEVQAGAVLSARRAWESARWRHDQVWELYRLSQASAPDLSDTAAQVNSLYAQLLNARYAFLAGLSRIRSLGCFEEEPEALLGG